MKSIQALTTLHIFWNKLLINLNKTVSEIHRRFSDKIYTIIFANILLIAFQFIYLKLRYSFLNSQVPLWYTKIWGDAQLADKQMLFIIPLLALSVFILGLLFTIPIKKYFLRHGMTIIGYVTLATNFVLTISLLRIIFSASTPFTKPLINPLYLDLLLPGIIAFVIISLILPRFISFAFDNGLVTNPSLHNHPGMLLTEPSARGGGFVFGILFLLLAIIFVGFYNMIAFYIALLLLAVLGILDDYQNTHPESKLKILENPYIRLIMLFLIVSIVSTLGVKIFSITNPLGGIFFFNSNVLSFIITAFWIVWVLNVLSWSNGVDGQYSGIVGIASILIILLALRFHPLSLEDKRVAVLAAISAGLCFGFIRYTWHPSKIMWGFGATTAGLVLSVLSIMINSKIITSIIIILIPFLDALVTALRRIVNGKSPLKGDRGHLHHILLKRGWSVGKIAIFYWLTTGVFGGLGYLTSERFTLQVGLILVGVTAFIIVLLNLKFGRDIPAKNLNSPFQIKS